jgi:hypothetical protein
MIWVEIAAHVHREVDVNGNPAELKGSVMDFLLWLLIGWIGGSVFVGVHAHKRGRNGLAWFLPSLIISPLITWLVLVSLQKKASDTATAIAAQNQMLFDSLAPEAKARVIEAQEQRETKKQADTLAYYKQRRLAVWAVLGFAALVYVMSNVIGMTGLVP